MVTAARQPLERSDVLGERDGAAPFAAWHRRRGTRVPKRFLMIACSAAYMAATTALRLFWRVAGVARVRPTVVLTYHAVTAADLRGFERQMEYLRHRARSVFADDAAPGTDRSVAVTFDDAFENVFDLALPVMARHGIPATIFVPTGSLGRTAGWIASEERARSLGRVAPAAALAHLDARRVRIGSHTVTHPPLAHVDDSRLDAELAASKEILERLTGAPISLLALPHGSCSARVVSAAHSAGYTRVFSNVPIPRWMARLSPLAGRVDASPSDWPLEFRLKAAGAYEWMAVAVPAKHGLRRLFGAHGRGGE
jgi:peptidoglycan/xylan/chitin deacetylase (PgdA/CDA1 family)